MRFSILISMLVCFVGQSFGQQEDQFTLFMQNKIGLNPAYAGVENGAIVTALTRNQWIGFDGAPTTQLINMSLPRLGGKVGIGGSIMHHTIGFTERYSAEIGYSYPLQINDGELRIGIQTSVRYVIMDFNKAEGIQPIGIDPSVPFGVKSKYIPNFGAGVYFNVDNVYVGLSVPRLLNNSIDFSDESVIVTKEVIHAYLMGGAKFELNENLGLNANILMKYVQDAPFDADINVNLTFSNLITTGVGYRLGGSENAGFAESISGILGVNVSKNIAIGFAYDMTLSDLRDYNSGTVEGFLQYRFGGNSREGEDPEFFDPRNGDQFYRK